MTVALERLRVADGFVGRADDVFAALLEAHQGLSDDESAALNARLILVLANQVGDPDAVIEAIQFAAEARPRTT